MEFTGHAFVSSITLAGHSKKYVTLHGVRWGVTKCDRGGEGSSATCDVMLVNYFYNTFYRN